MNQKASLKRNALINLLGSALPMVVSLVTVPLYLRHVGAARYGVLAIVWMLQGYFGYFDLGLSAATSNRISQLGESSPVERESVFWTALLLNASFGMIGGVIFFVAARVLISQFHIGSALDVEVMAALPWMACSVPVATVSGVFVGALTGREQFAPLNGVQLFGMLIFQTVPLVTAVMLGSKLQYLIASAILGSVASLLLLIAVVIVTFPLRFAAGPRKSHVRPLFSYGAWITVTNLVSPLLETADRLLIGSTLGPQAVAYYQVPFNLAVRVRILPGVLSRTLFPRLSALQVTNAAELATSAVRGLAAVMTPLIVFGIFLMQPFLAIWIGPAFASKAASIGQLILIGVWINSLAYIPLTHLQAIGRPDIVARFHAVELVPFVGFLWWSMHSFGLAGAAFAWSARCAVDGLLLFWVARFGSRLTVHLYVPALLVIAAYAMARALPWQSWVSVAVWFALTVVSIVWAVATISSARSGTMGAMRLMPKRIWRRT